MKSERSQTTALPASLLGRGPICHGALRSFLLAVADDAAALAAVLDYGPEKADLGMCKVSVLLVVERRRRIEEGAFIHSGISSAEMKARELTFSKSEIGGCGLKAPAPQSGSSSFLSW